MLDSVPTSLPVREAPANKKSRRGTRKSRSGCITCKIRRIKCDETQPACQKCISTGRSCDGYAIQPSLRHQALVVAVTRGTHKELRPNPFLNFAGSRRDHRILSYFFGRTAPGLSGAFDAEFWNHLIPQVAYSEPAVQHGLIAVAIAHSNMESLQHAFFSETELPASYDFTIHHYNQAIQHLSACLAQNQDSYDVALICCLLFICLEYIRGNVSQAITHLKGGLGILHSWHTKSEERGHPVGLASSAHLINEKLSQIYYRLRIQWALTGRPSDYLDSYVQQPQLALSFFPAFHNLIEARNTLDRLLNVAMRFVQSTARCIPPMAPNVLDGKQPKQQAILEQLVRWSSLFETYMKEHRDELDKPLLNGATTLRLTCLCGQLWMRTALEVTETAFDAIPDDFRAMVDLAASIEGPTSYADALHREGSSERPKFTFEMGVIAPLYFVARKCRHPQIRRQALSLLATTLPRCEGLWNAEYLGLVGQKVLDKEEAGVSDLLAADPDNFSLYIPEDKRVWDVIIHHDETPPDNPDKCWSVTFLTNPDGPDTPTVMTKEKIFARQ